MDKGRALPARSCGHPEWEMSHPGTPKPAACPVRYHCDCGENWGCPECGWGAGAWPCTCMRERQAEERKQNPEKNPYFNILVSPMMEPGFMGIAELPSRPTPTIIFDSALEDAVVHLA